MIDYSETTLADDMHEIKSNVNDDNIDVMNSYTSSIYS